MTRPWRIACLWLVVLGVALRVAALAWHDHPRGDVVLDTGVVAALSDGAGFASGFERGTLLLRGDGPPPPGDRADQHAPLWPLLAVPFAALAGSPFAGLQLAALVFGLLLLAQVWRLTDRLTEGIVGVPDGLPALAAALVALSFLAVDYSANGALYVAQASGVLLLVELLASRRPRPLAAGLVLGLLLLLNHQCLVLLPLPVVVAVLAARPGGRARGAGLGLAAVGVALALQAPWWWRNAAVFGDPFHSVNGLYLLHRLGVPPVLSLEDGRPVARWLGGLSPAAVLSALRGQLLPNLLYLFLAGLLVLPALLGPLLAAAAGDARRAVAAGDRRRLAAWGAGLLLAAVAVAWPATKLRYLLALLPLGTALGLAALARPPTRAQAGAALALVALWVGLLVATIDDVTGGAAHARPVRWATLAVAGLVSLAWPLWLRHGRAGASRRGWPLPVLAGLPLAAGLLAAALLPPPHTSYHSTPWLPDFFGQHADARDADAAAGLAAARRAMLAGVGDDRPTVIGPVGLLAWGDLRLITLPLGAGTAAGEAALAALLARPPGAARADFVVTLAGDGWLDGAGAPAGDDGAVIDDGAATDAGAGDGTGASPTPGAAWLGGRLVVAGAPLAGGVVVSRVVR